MEKQRAEWLAQHLRGANISAIWSTDLKRTRDTATPLAKHLNVRVVPYAPVPPNEFIQSLLDATGNTLVVGHSNTIPDLVNRLLGEPSFEPLPHWMHDRIFVLTVDQREVEHLEVHLSLPFSMPINVD